MTTYKMSDLDNALREIFGQKIADSMLTSHLGRAAICEFAASKCFKYELKGPHVDLLRTALLDLDQNAMFKNAEWDVE